MATAIEKLNSPRLPRRTLLAAAAALAAPWTGARAAASVRIGQVLPLTGPLGPVVQPIAEGQRALLDAVNARGGIHGAAIDLVTLDDAGASVVPASPAFYAGATHLQDLVDFVAGRVLDSAGVGHTLYRRWRGELGGGGGRST